MCPRETLLVVCFGKCSFLCHTAGTRLLAAGLKKLTQKYNESIGGDNSSHPHPPNENHKRKAKKIMKSTAPSVRLQFEVSSNLAFAL